MARRILVVLVAASVTDALAFAPALHFGRGASLPRLSRHRGERKAGVAMINEEKIAVGTVKVSPMGIGTLNWPLNKETDSDAEASLRACVDAGVNFIDTAEAYGFGTSEKLTRNVVGAVNGQCVVATKFAPVPWRRDSEDLVAACKASKERLGVEAIDLYQIHWPDIIQPLKPFGFEEVKNEKYWDGIARCYEQGLIKNVGVSNYGVKILEQAHAALSARGVPIASNQINYSLLYRKSGAQATVDKCKELGIQPIGYFPLANGLLAGRYTAGNPPKGPKGWTMKKYIEGGVTSRGVAYPAGGVTPLIDEMRRIGDARGKTVPQVAINFVICKGVIPIPGARNAKMAADNAGALGWRLSAAEVVALEAAADGLGFEFSGGGFKLE